MVAQFHVRNALQCRTNSCRVHKREHGLEPSVGLAEQETRRAIEVHDTGRVAVNTHFVLQRATVQRIPVAQRAVVVDQVLGDNKQ